MDLLRIAKHFDTQPVHDGYTGHFLFNAQFSSFNDADAMGSTATRRVMSVAPDIAIPEHRAVRIANTNWIIGNGSPDLWFRDVIRQSFNMKQASDLAYIGTPGQILLDTGYTLAYTQKTYFNEVPDSLNTSDLTLDWSFFVAPSVPLQRGSIIKCGTEYFRAMEQWLPIEDLRTAKARRLGTVPTTAAFALDSYDPRLDQASGAAVSVPAFLVPATQLYRHVGEDSPKPQKGDATLLVSNTVTAAKVGATVTVLGAKYLVVSVKPELDCWMVMVRQQ